MGGSPSSSTITDAMSSYLKPSLWHCVSHMNLGSCHPAVLVTTLGMKLSSSLFSFMSTSMSFSQSSLGLLPDCFALSQPYSTVNKTHSVRTAVQLSYSSCLVSIKCSLPFHVYLPFNKHQARGDPPLCGITHTFALTGEAICVATSASMVALVVPLHKYNPENFSKFPGNSISRSMCHLHVLILLPFPFVDGIFMHIACIQRFFSCFKELFFVFS